jgi:hypothetical protein
MSVDAAESFFSADPASPAIRLRYEDLIADPVGLSRRLLEFLGLEPDPAVERFAADQVRRRTPPAPAGSAPPEAAQIAGDALRRLGYAI